MIVIFVNIFSLCTTLHHTLHRCWLLKKVRLRHTIQQRSSKNNATTAAATTMLQNRENGKNKIQQLFYLRLAVRTLY